VINTVCDDSTKAMEPAAPPAAKGAAEPPVTIIERKPGWHLLGLGEMWRFRELLFFLVWRDVKVRYKQTALGAAWAVLQPLATMAAFSLFLGKVASSEHDPIPYPLFVLTGLLPWTFFASAVTGAGNSVVLNERLVTKIYFPRLLVPFGAVAASAFDMLIALVMLLVVTVGYLVWPNSGFTSSPGLNLLVVPCVVLVVICLASGLGVFLAAVTVAYRDFRAVVPLALQLWMFATPSIFLQDWSNRNLGWLRTTLLPLNPMHGVVVNFRAATVGGQWEPWALAVSAAWAVFLLMLGCFYFRRVERGFADII
jgi:lipopolysaccharide transport system permease protein